MVKRARSDNLTGGLGDDDIAQLSSNVSAATSATAAVTVSIATPITVIAARGESIAMEIVRVIFQYDNNTAAGALPTANIWNTGGTTSSSIQMTLATKNFGVLGPALSTGDALVFASAYINSSSVAAGATLVTGNQLVYDCTDGAGHGFLVGTNNIFFQLLQNTPVTINGRVKILYRLKKVTQQQLTTLLLSQNQG